MFHVAILAGSDEQCAELCGLVERTGMGRVAVKNAKVLNGGRDYALKQVHEAKPDVVLVEISPEQPTAALMVIKQLHAEAEGTAIFAVGEMSQPKLIVSAMQNGASEFLERHGTPGSLHDAFTRLTAKKRGIGATGRGKVFTIINAKGGSGATTVAVNTAIALEQYGPVAMVDLAPLGSLAVHLNVKPAFGVLEALRNLHRLDAALLAGFMTQTESGPNLLAGSAQPVDSKVSAEAFAQLFDVLVSQYKYVVVDLSTRFDAVARTVANLSNCVVVVSQPDLTSLWSANKVRQYLSDGNSPEKFGLVVNRFRRIASFSDAETEATVGCKLWWKIPNQYHAIAASIESGQPVSQANRSEIARCYADLASTLVEKSGGSRASARPVVVTTPQEQKSGLFSRLMGFKAFSPSTASEF